MANMSYCRFRNTLIDMMDCLNTLEEGGLEEIESREEREAAEDLYATAKRLVDAYETAQADARDRRWVTSSRG